MVVDRSHARRLSVARIAGIALAVLAIAACGRSPGHSAAAPIPNGSTPYRVVDASLESLKADFNAQHGKVRLLFIVGPTCGVCLRGMDELNSAVVAQHQTDAKLATLVVHVPTLGAEAKDVPAAMDLLKGPRVAHYWDEIGTTGRQFQEVLGIDVYAWDVWMIYGPDAVWDAKLPPAPDFWRHQLMRVDKMPKLDAKEFASEVERRLALTP